MKSNKKKFVTIVVGGIVLLTISGIVVTKSGPFINSLNNSVTNNNASSSQVAKEEPKQTENPTIEEAKKEEVTINPTVPSPNSALSNEEQAVEYFVNMEAEVEEYVKNNSLKSSASNAFISITDFIFYGGEIKGVTFEQISDSSKLTILNVAKSMDNTISNKWPTYKEDIKDTTGKAYSATTSKISEGISYLDKKIEEAVGKDPYDGFKEGASNAADEIKDVAGNVFEAGKEIAGDAKEKVKSWYENFKEKNKSN